MPKSMHSMRLDDDMWKLFVVKAKKSGDSAANVVGEMIRRYVEGQQDDLPAAAPKPEESELSKQFHNRALSEGIDPADAMAALMELYVTGGVSFKRTLTAVMQEK